jgi:carboxypeptidase family protein
MRGLRRVLVLLAALAAISSPAFAQATLTGAVKDSSGLVLPGVTVEASSPVLIEKTRSAVTDGNGRYQIIDLRPGQYTVTFTLAGFSTVKREAVPLTGSFTTSADAEMRVGNVTETVTVTGETPVVDLQSATQQRVIDHAVIDALPTARDSFAVGGLIPGTTVKDAFGSVTDVGGALGPSTYNLVIHGGKTEDQRLTMNGVSLSTMIGGGWGGGAIPNPSGFSEVTIDTAAVSAELATGGVRINFIPKDGGNQIRGTIFGSFANDSMQGEHTRTRGTFAPIRANTVKQNWDFNPGIGGPIKRDRLWFYVSARAERADTFVPGMFHNKNANNPNAFTVDYDLSRPAVLPREWAVYQGRLTFQASPRNKLGLTYDTQSNCFCPTNVGPGVFGGISTPEAGNDQRFPLQRYVQVDWNSPISSKLLLEVSGIHRVERWGGMHLQTGGDGLAPTDPKMIAITDQATTLNYRSAAQFNNSWNVNLHYRAALSYITGSHAYKVGFNNAWGHHENQTYALNPISYTFFAGQPSAVTLRATPYTQQVDVNADLGIFAQDKWTHNHLTMSYGVRYDRFKNSFPEQTLEPGPLTPNRNVTYARRDNLNWHDITPKSSLTYDLFGNGRTALKLSMNKYLTGYGTFAIGGNNGISNEPNPIGILVNQVTRTWHDDNHDFVPNCDLLLPAKNGECEPLNNTNFGLAVPGSTYDPDLMTGWGKRTYNWEFSTGVQHELLPRVSMEVSYFRRWYGNFVVRDNRALVPSDFNQYSITAPANSDLPGGGGYAVTGLYGVKPEKFGVPADNFVTRSDAYGKQTDHWNGVDINLSARPRSNFIIQGGVSTGRTVTDNCDVASALPETNFGFAFFIAETPLQFCHRNERFITQVKGFASYTIPKADVQVSGTYQSAPGPLVSANYFVFSGQAGVPLPGIPFQTVNILEPGAKYGDRLNQVDLRFAKIVRIGRTRTNINFDLYNLFSADPILKEEPTYSIWRTPLNVLQSRFVKIGAQFDF